MRRSVGRAPRLRRSRWFLGVVLGGFGLLTLVSMTFLESESEEKSLNRKQVDGSTKSGEKHAAAEAEEGKGKWEFLIVSDMDSQSYDDERGIWTASLQHGILNEFGEDGGFEVEFKHDEAGLEMSSEIAEEGRGMELSELETFDGNIITGDDHTGILFRVLASQSRNPSVEQWIKLADGDGQHGGSFKVEWMVIKDGILFVGSHGRETTDPHDPSKVLGRERMWVKKVDEDGSVEHVNWISRYEWLRQQVGAPFPGYLVHEAVLWDKLNRHWIFFPRRYSKEGYDELDIEKKGWNRALVVSEDFTTLVREIEFADLPVNERGFSSVKFLPNSKNRLVLALRTLEISTPERYETFVSILNLETEEVVMPETIIHATKYEGLVFL